MKSYLNAAVIMILMATSATAQTGTLTLACKGTTVSGIPDAKPEPFSMSLLANFTTGTVRGFDAPDGPLPELPVKITGINEVLVAFGGFDRSLGSERSLSGTIDRVTGEVEAHDTLTSEKTREMYSSTSYSLKCRPAQRMF